MTTLVEEYNIDEQRFVVRFLWAKGFNAKDIHKEMFPIYVGKCLLRKAAHNSVANVSLMSMRLKWKWLRLQSKTSMLQFSAHW
jgi:hypothetical protein